MKVLYHASISLALMASKSFAIAPQSVGECETECDDDSHCKAGLLCADVHEALLAKNGLDKRKAYCGPGKNPAHIQRTMRFEVCFDPKKIGNPNFPNIPVPYKPPSPLIQKCQMDCDLDIDCEKGFMCADEHKAELIAAGLDGRFADCPVVASAPKNYEVCFDPKTLPCKGCIFGDPHFVTYDGTRYSYHGQCDLVMARSRSFSDALGLDLHIRTEIISDWSLISNAAVKIGEDTFELVKDGSYYINGVKDVPLPAYLGQDHKITTSTEYVHNTTTRTHFTIQLREKGEKISMNVFKGMVAVRVDAVLPESDGMLGIRGKIGMIARDGQTVLTDPNRMGAEWQVRDNEPMLFHEARSPQFPTECTLPSVQSRRRLRKQEYTVAQDACANVSAEMYNFCVEDVLRTGDPDVAIGFGFGFAF